MTQRKPADLSFESWIEAQIREARERGAFDDLPGTGRPLASLTDADDPAWWAKQLLRREGLSVLPPALEVRRDVERLREGLARIPSERLVREAVNALNETIRRLNRTAVGGPPTCQSPLDVEELVARWRALRAEG
jgi:DnaJ homologue, subfamily C, member 28, conserved domain